MDTIEQIEFWVSVEQCLEPREFGIIYMHYKLKMNQEQIAEEIGCCQQSVSRYLNQIKNKLKNSL